MKILSLIGILVVFLCSSVQAACPDIDGRWILFGSSLEFGDRVQGVGAATFKKSDGSSEVDKVTMSIYNAFFGVKSYEKFTADVSVNSSCKVTITEPGAEWSGYIVNKDKMSFIGNEPESESSFQVVMERQDLIL
jgi:hypothetical protein